MSKNGRRIRAADQRRRSSFRGMMACFAGAALLIGLLLLEASYSNPPYSDLAEHRGAYADLKTVSQSRSRAKRYYRLIFENGETFCVYRDLDAVAFENRVRRGEELIVLVDERRDLWHIRNSFFGEPLAFEIRTAEGETLRSYASACAWQQKNRRSIMIYDGAFALLLAAFGIAELRSWKRNARLLREMKARKDG